MKVTSLWHFALILFIVTTVTPVSHAATVAVVNGGRLDGFNGVEVGGLTYDVSFIEGSALTIFGGASGFDFTTTTQAIEASEALLDTFKLFPLYDNDPRLTNGCTFTVSICMILTPFEAATAVHSGTYFNFPSTGSDIVFISSPQLSTDTGDIDFMVMADWTVRSVPEPRIATLIVIGLISLLGISRRNNRITRVVA